MKERKTKLQFWHHKPLATPETFFKLLRCSVIISWKIFLSIQRHNQATPFEFHITPHGVSYVFLFVCPLRNPDQISSSHNQSTTFKLKDCVLSYSAFDALWGYASQLFLLFQDSFCSDGCQNIKKKKLTISGVRATGDKQGLLFCSVVAWFVCVVMPWWTEINLNCKKEKRTMNSAMLLRRFLFIKKHIGHCKTVNKEWYTTEHFNIEQIHGKFVSIFLYLSDTFNAGLLLSSLITSYTHSVTVFDETLLTASTCS